MRRCVATGMSAFAVAWALGGCGRGHPPEVAAPVAPPVVEVVVRSADPVRAASLGRRIFFDRGLSASGKMSCASCHDPAHAYGPPNGLPVQLGGAAMDRQGFRAAPSLRYVLNRTPRWSKQFQADPVERLTETDSVPTGGFARDGRFDTLHDQALAPLLDPAEMANADRAGIAARLRAAPYIDEFVATFGADVLADDRRVVDDMLAAVERFELDDVSFHPYTSKYDRHLQGREALSPREQRGLQLFIDPKKGNCAACHLAAPGADGSPPLFTDFSFSALGAPRNPKIAANSDPRFFDLGLCGPSRRDQATTQTYCGMFKTPSLRNVASRAVLMHNGVFVDLATAVRFYAERDVHAEKYYPAKSGGAARAFDDLPPGMRGNVDVIDAPLDRKAGEPPALNEAEVQDIVAFLHTLTDDDVRSLAPVRQASVATVGRGAPARR